MVPTIFNQLPKREVPEEKRTIFRIPARNLAKFEREIENLSKKSVRGGGFPVSVAVIGRFQKKGTDKITYEVWLDAPMVQVEGYSFVAVLDHALETGTIVRQTPNTDVAVPARYFSAKPDCDHCRLRRQRHDTYLLQKDETGEFVQVGSTCLNDFFTGINPSSIDPRAIARSAEILGYAREAGNKAEIEDDFDLRAPLADIRDERHIDLETYLQNTAAVIRANGWVSGKIAYEQGRVPTSKIAYRNMFSHAVPVLPEDVKLAEDALAWAQSLRQKPEEELSGYENNVLVIADAISINGRSAGIAASIVGVYHRKQQAQKPRARAFEIADMAPLLALFDTAGTRLQNPKITIEIDGVGPVKIRVLSRGKHPGSLTLEEPGSFHEKTDWYGYIHRNGQFAPSRMAPPALEAGLRAFAADPAGYAAAHGHKTGNCCFCSIPLSDARSVKAGYGEICAAKWNLPYPTKAEMKATVPEAA